MYGGSAAGFIHSSGAALQLAAAEMPPPRRAAPKALSPLKGVVPSVAADPDGSDAESLPLLGLIRLLRSQQVPEAKLEAAMDRQALLDLVAKPKPKDAADAPDDPPSSPVKFAMRGETPLRGGSPSPGQSRTRATTAPARAQRGRPAASAPPEPVKLEPPKGESRKTRAVNTDSFSICRAVSLIQTASLFQLYKLAASMGENGLDAAVDFKPLLDKYLSDDENSVDDKLPRRSDFTWILIRF